MCAFTLIYCISFSIIFYIFHSIFLDKYLFIALNISTTKIGESDNNITINHSLPVRMLREKNSLIGVINRTIKRKAMDPNLARYKILFLG